MSNGAKLSLIAIGALNLLHGLMHLLQFVQSIFMASYSFGLLTDGGWLHKLMENPLMGLLWASIGITAVIVGIKDYKYHKDKH